MTLSTGEASPASREEEWVYISETNERYAVSNYGRVASWRGGEPRLLKQRLNKSGYPAVTLTLGGDSRLCTVHRLVAETFVRNFGGFSVVNHKDGNKQNPRAWNLEWTSHRGNIVHARDNGLFKPGSHKLSLEKADRIRALRAVHKVSVEDLAKEFGVSKATINSVLTGRSWTTAGDAKREDPRGNIWRYRQYRVKQRRGHGRLKRNASVSAMIPYGHKAKLYEGLLRDGISFCQFIEEVIEEKYGRPK